MDFPLHRFEEFGVLSNGERQMLAGLAEPPRRFPRQGLIRREADIPKGFFLLLDGWVAASHILSEGDRQILKIHLPGDALGTPSMCMRRTVEELRAITDVVAVHVPFDRFGRWFEEHPRLAARFLLSVQLERVALMDRLASIGRTSAQARVATFLLDLVARLEPLDLVRGDAFFLPLTQAQIADVVGLTAVHINRTLRALEAANLIHRSGQQYRLLDRKTLAELSGQPRHERVSEPEWLPAGR